jgi:HSP20 family protein
MHTIIHPQSPSRRVRPSADAADAFRSPIYDCQTQGAALTLVVYLPGVDATGVSIEARGPDLLITGQKTRFVRVNWEALHLEKAQHDYRLKLRLGRAIAYEAMQAEIHQGVLTLVLPKRRAGSARPAARWPRVA